MQCLQQNTHGAAQHSKCTKFCCFLLLVHASPLTHPTTPPQLFGAVDAADADLDDTPDCGGADLMSNRHEAWQELCISKADDLRKRADNSAAQIAALEKQIEAEALSGSRSLDRLAMVKLQQEDLKRKVAAEKAVLAPLMTPPAAAQQQQQVAVAAAGKGSTGGGVGAPGAGQQVVVSPAAAQLGLQQRLLLQQQLAGMQHLPPAQQQALQQQLMQQLRQQQQQYMYLTLMQQQQQQQLLQQQAKKQ